MIFNSPQNSLVANLLLSFISNQQNVFFDAREEDVPQTTTNLKRILNTTSSLQVNGNTLQVYDTQFTGQFTNILRFYETFALYVKNRYLSISPSDLIKISTWLNNQWNGNKIFDFGLKIKLVFEKLIKFFNNFPSCEIV